MTTLFFHLRKDADHVADVTIAGKVINNRLTMSASRTSPRDNFSKKKGRAIAEGRLAKGKVIFSDVAVSTDMKKLGTQFRNEAIELAKQISNHGLNLIDISE